MHRLAVLAPLFLAGGIIACGGGGGAGSGGLTTGADVQSMTLRKGGGDASVWSGEFTIEVGPRSVLVDTQTRVTRNPTVPVPPFGRIVRSYTFQPFPFSFIQYPSAILKYNRGEVSNEAKLSAFILIRGQWAEAIQARVDPERQEVTCRIAGLDPIALIERR
jgi:hypothetical protein